MTPQHPGDHTDAPVTAEFAAQPAPRDRSGVAVVLLALLVVGAVVLGIWLYNSFLAADDLDRPAAGPMTTVVTAAPTTAPQTTAPSESTAAARPTFRAPDGAEQCAANVRWRIYRATEQTSCEFAEAVAVAMVPNTGRDLAHDVRAASPVTGRVYEMRCSPEGDNSFTCRGGDNAVVVLEARAVRD